MYPSGHPSEQRPTPTSKSDREPWLAANLSKICPGIGQIYAGQLRKGLGFLLGYFFLIGLGGALLSHANVNVFLGICALVAAFLVIPIWNIFDAYYTARRQNSQEFESERRQNKDPWLAIFLSGFIPGLGHVYLQQWLLGMILLVIFSVLLFAGSLHPIVRFFVGLLWFVLSLFAMIHIYVVTPRHREHKNSTFILFLLGLLVGSFIFNIIVAVVIRAFILEARFIASSGMEPALIADERVFVNKLAYRLSSPKRGDIILFSPPETLQQMGIRDPFLKRIIGLPGDQVAVINSRIHINGKPLAEPYLSPEVLTSVERCNDLNAFLSKPQTIPADSYFVLGDNRDNSLDSRCWGVVPRENIIGKVFYRFYSLRGNGFLEDP